MCSKTLKQDQNAQIRHSSCFNEVNCYNKYNSICIWNTPISKTRTNNFSPSQPCEVFFFWTCCYFLFPRPPHLLGSPHLLPGSPPPHLDSPPHNHLLIDGICVSNCNNISPCFLASKIIKRQINFIFYFLHGSMCIQLRAHDFCLGEEGH